MPDGHTLLIVSGPDGLAPADTQALEARGFTVLRAPNDQDGRLLAETQWPDVLLWSPTLDPSAHMQLPTWLRSMDPAVGLVLFAGETNIRAVANAVRIGFDDCILAPVGSRELIRTVDEVLRLVLTRRGRQPWAAAEPPSVRAGGEARGAELPLERLCAAVAGELRDLAGVLQNRLARIATVGPGAVLDATVLLSSVSARLTLLQGRLRSLGSAADEEAGSANVAVELREAVALARAASGSDETAVECRLPPDLPRAAVGGAALRQVLAEVVHNAILATAGSEEKRVHVSVRTEEDTIRIEVEDTGIGLLPGEAGRIFEPLAARRRVSFGMGIGLCCCRRALDSVGATLTADGGPGRGAVFTARIPTLLPNGD